MVIVDSTVWIDYLRGTDNAETRWLERELQLRRLGLTDLILCEVLQGLRDRKTCERVRAELLRLEVFHSGGIDIAVAAAENYRQLRQRGFTVHKTIDCLIATFCLQSGHELLHRDQAFDCFEKVLGLRAVHP
jgi:predicted nucleic acid-binding protein